MNPKDEEIQTVTNQLKKWSTQMESLAAKQEAAAAAAKKYTVELDELRAKCSLASQRLHELESAGSSLYMWENIGDGG